MKILLYCVIRRDSRHPHEPQPGLKGRPLQVVAENGLAAVFSEIDQSDALLTTEAATEYHDVIARMHRERDLIPFRFRTLLDGVSDVREVLRAYRDRFSEVLTLLEGCVEMGLRILLPEKCSEDERSRQARGSAVGEKRLDEALPGTSYLLSRKLHYTRDLFLEDVTQRTVDEYSSHFRELCTAITYERATECSHKGERSVMVSVYFLVPRDKEQSFRDAFHALDDQKRARARMTGPWPPYNFVVTSLAEGTAGTSLGWSP
jgi:hypothetical protein